MGKWGIYNTSLEFFNNLQIGDRIKYNRGMCIVEGEIIQENKPIKSCKLLLVTKKTDCGVECSLCENERIMILPSHSDRCEVI